MGFESHRYRQPEQAERRAFRTRVHAVAVVQPVGWSTPRRSIERECARRGHDRFVESCSRMLDGDDSDAGLIVALGGPAGQALIDRGLPSSQRYWPRVWAARGLYWAWGDQALPFLIEAAADEQWRVREWVAKIAGRHGLLPALPVLRRLLEDRTPRVRVAAHRAVAELGDLSGHGAPSTRTR